MFINNTFISIHNPNIIVIVLQEKKNCQKNVFDVRARARAFVVRVQENQQKLQLQKCQLFVGCWCYLSLPHAAATQRRNNFLHAIIAIRQCVRFCVCQATAHHRVQYDKAPGRARQTIASDAVKVYKIKYFCHFYCRNIFINIFCIQRRNTF